MEQVRHSDAYGYDGTEEAEVSGEGVVGDSDIDAHLGKT